MKEKELSIELIQELSTNISKKSFKHFRKTLENEVEFYVKKNGGIKLNDIVHIHVGSIALLTTNILHLTEILFNKHAGMPMDMNKLISHYQSMLSGLLEEDKKEKMN